MKKLRFLFANILPVCCKCLMARLLILFGYCRDCDNVWLVSERGTDARDNGFFFFRYLRTNQPQISCCYVIKKDSADYPKVAGVGKTVEYGSLKHYAMLLCADCLISSHIMGYTPNPEVFLILERRKLLTLRGKKIFLQHGIIKNNIEGLKYPHVKPDIFICGALAEYNFIHDQFRHPEGVVHFTGLARYDSLINEDKKKQILLMPTWRKWLNSCSPEQFAQTDYYHRYHQLLSDSVTHEWLRKRGLTLVFYPHYEMQRFIELFASLESDVVHISRFEQADVQTLLKESSLLVTDYSSVYFDFAYLGKPILYYQFDQQRFLSEHYSKGYFDEGSFGKVAVDYETLRDALFSSYIEDCFVNPHQEAQAKFFGSLTNGCCSRIYQVITQLFGEKYD